MVKEEVMVTRVIKLMAVITLKKTNGEGEVSRHIMLKINKQTTNIRFCANRKGPYKVRVII